VMALRCVSAVEPLAGSKVLIVGAPGGAGSFAVQLAAAKGAHVIATGLADDREYLTGLGAAEIVEPGEALASQVRERHPDGIDALIDLVSYRPAFLRHAGLLRQGGAAASVHRSADDEALGELGLRGVNVNSAPDRALLEELAAQAVTGALQVSIAFRYPLAFTVQGLEDAKELHSRGKRVVVLDQDEQAPS